MVHEGTYCYVPVITSDNRTDEQHVGRGKQVSLLSQTSDWSPSCASRLKQSHRRQRRFVRVSINKDLNKSNRWLSLGGRSVKGRGFRLTGVSHEQELGGGGQELLSLLLGRTTVASPVSVLCPLVPAARVHCHDTTVARAA